MACSSDFVQFIVDQCSGAGEIAVKKMMGDYCIYCDGVLFGLICDNNLFIKQTDAGEAVLDEVVLRPPYPSARDHFYITNVDDRDYLEDIVRATVPELMSGKSKAKRSAVNRQVPVSLDEAISPNIVCSQDLRAFFEQYLGPSFRFKVEFQSWLRENAGLTFRDAVEAYPTLIGRYMVPETVKFESKDSDYHD
ncbi:MAG: TfoX/Sxy family protein [Bacteroidales bacterium]|nr:TfoX/Sxy family protein [Bacteroidales bacterium]